MARVSTRHAHARRQYGDSTCERAGMTDALADGVASGLREHVPGAVGIIIKSVAVCASLALVHLVLAIPIASTAIGVTGLGATSYLISLTRKAS
jgi:hypothetical protein